MKLFRLERRQPIPITIKEAWEFFSSPKNLARITPQEMGFEILPESDIEKIYPGQIIAYRIKPVINIPLTWVTEITHVQAPNYFVDEQRFGPYSFWHHKHFFTAIEGGTLTRDVVHYGLPMGPVGTIANKLFVEKKLNDIFNYRATKMVELFGEFKLTVKKTNNNNFSEIAEVHDLNKST